MFAVFLNGKHKKFSSVYSVSLWLIPFFYTNTIVLFTLTTFYSIMLFHILNKEFNIIYICEIAPGFQERTDIHLSYKGDRTCLS